MPRIRSVCVGLLLAVPFYLLLIDTTSTPELLAGACAAVLAAFVYRLACAEGFGHAAYRLTWLRRTWWVLAQVPVQTVIVCGEIVRQTLSPRSRRGRLTATAFHAPDDHDVHDLGRRALAEALGSLTPNTIVIGVDPERDLLLVHQLCHLDGPEQLDPLRLGSRTARE